jgi:polysaccharide export outer membrane protein
MPPESAARERRRVPVRPPHPGTTGPANAQTLTLPVSRHRTDAPYAMPRACPPGRGLTAALLLATLVLASCEQFPKAGPSEKEIEEGAARTEAAGIQIVDVDDAVARRLVAQRLHRSFSETLGQERTNETRIGAGDTVEVTIWEAPPATLFGTAVEPRSGVSTSRPATLPEQIVDYEGFIGVPFAGRVRAQGETPRAVEDEIVRRLRGKANQPEVMVRLTKRTSAAVTVVGDVANSLRLPLTPSGERLLDALAAAGGVRQPVNKMMLQVTRGDAWHTMPLDQVIRDPRQNVPLRAGDVVTALYQPYSFTALGATGRNEEIGFEAQGINLAQALARAGGLIDTRSSPQGVFIFRFEPAGALDWPRQPAVTTPEGRVAVVYRVDLLNPASYFVMQSFPIQHKDVLYVSNAPAAELQKFLNIIFSVTFPIGNTVQTFQ